MSELSKLQADLEFLQEVGPLMADFEAKRANKAVDPQAWFDAKHAFEEKRTYWRLIGEYLAAAGAPPDSSNVTIAVDTSAVIADTPTIPTAPEA